MAEPKGFATPEDALLAVATCLADLSVESNQTPPQTLEVEVFVGNEGDGGVLDCCVAPILRVEGMGELTADGIPRTLAAHGCVNFTENILVTFLTCWTTNKKDGTVKRDAASLAYGLAIMRKRWEAVQMLRCCRDPRIKYLSSTPIPSDGKCAGFEIRLTAPVELCGPCNADPASS